MVDTSAIRVVKFGDAVLSDDHNSLRTALIGLNSEVQLVKPTFMKSDYYGITDEFTVSKTALPFNRTYGVCKYAKKLGTMLLGAVRYYLTIKGELKTNNANASALALLAIHYTQVTVGQTFLNAIGEPPDYVDYAHINVDGTVYDVDLGDSWGRYIDEDWIDDDCYLALWVAIVHYNVPPTDIVGYFKKIRCYGDARPLL